METRIKAFHSIEATQLPLARAQREQIFGDVPEGERSDTSLPQPSQIAA